MSPYRLFSSSRELPRPAVPSFPSRDAEAPYEEEVATARQAPGAAAVAPPGVRQTSSLESLLAPVVLPLIVIGLLLMLAGSAYALFNTPTHTANPVVKDLIVDNDHNVRYLSVNISGKPYVCNPAMTSLGEILVHCDPAASTQ